MSDKGLSKELSAMAQLEEALNALSEEERGRVLSWAGSRFGVAIAAAQKTARAKVGGGAEDDADEAQEDKPDASTSLAEFYDAAAPTSDGEKVLVVAYWFQYRQGETELDAQKLNSNLKHLGHGIGNVTRALESNKSQKPALIVQMRKEGTTKQARKKFKVTNEGKKVVERMLNKST